MLYEVLLYGWGLLVVLFCLSFKEIPCWRLMVWFPLAVLLLHHLGEVYGSNEV